MSVPTDHELLVRIDERVEAIQRRLPDFVTRSAFEPIQRVVWAIVVAGLASLIAGGFVLAKGG